MDLPELVQWPAFAASLTAAWLLASNAASRRSVGCGVFLASNVLWVAWSLHAGAWALVALQLGLAALDVRGLLKTQR